MEIENKWMKLALCEARKAELKGEVPVGAVIVRDNKLISKAHNQPIANTDPTAHAEIQAIRLASKSLNNYRLTGLTIYVTLEPCIMCLGAIANARISKIFFGAYDAKSGACCSCLNSSNKHFINHKIEIVGGVLSSDSKALLQSIFKTKR